MDLWRRKGALLNKCKVSFSDREKEIETFLLSDETVGKTFEVQSIKLRRRIPCLG